MPARRIDLTRATLVIGGLLWGGLTVALVRLSWALLRQDYALVYVAKVSDRSTHGLYRLAGLWGGSEGSLLLWAWCSSLVGLIAIVSLRRARPLPAVGGVLCAVSGALAAIVVTAANPFERLPMPAVNGRGLAPVLEHPSMLVHPPLIYVALVCTTVPFALSVAALWTGRCDPAWRHATLRWATASWCLLTAGMALGAHWAYQELGWGGYWAWDPVENASLLPWLGLTAAIHQLHRGNDRASAVTTMATYLVTGAGAVVARSGSVASVHAFSDDAATGHALLAVLLVALAVSLAALVRGWATTAPAAGTRRHRGLAAPIAGVAALVVGIGTFTPVVAPWFGGSDRLVLGHFYARLVAPLALLALVALWRHGSHRGVGLLLGALVGAVLGVVGHPAWPTVLVAVACATAVSLVTTVRRPHGLAHLGVVVVLMAIAGTALGESRTVRLIPGGAPTIVDDREVQLVGTTVLPADGPWQRIQVEVNVGDQHLTPELRIDERRARASSESHLSAGWWVDVQATVRDVSASGAVTIDVSVRPLVGWLWVGAALMTLGAAWSWRQARRTRSTTSTASHSPMAAGTHHDGTDLALEPTRTPVRSTA